MSMSEKKSVEHYSNDFGVILLQLFIVFVYFMYAMFFYNGFKIVCKNGKNEIICVLYLILAFIFLLYNVSMWSIAKQPGAGIAVAFVLMLIIFPFAVPVTIFNVFAHLYPNFLNSEKLYLTMVVLTGIMWLGLLPMLLESLTRTRQKRHGTIVYSSNYSPKRRRVKNKN